MPCPAIFLDRDGVINVDHGYVHKSENFEFIDGIFDVARQAHERGYKLVVITNQAGIGRGYYSEMDFSLLTDWMCRQFNQAGAPISKVYFSPYHPTEGVGEYLKDDISRKPHPGMILQAMRELDIDLGMSILIGDKMSDVQAGIAAGVGINLLFAQGRPQDKIHPSDCQHIAFLQEALPFLANSPKPEDTQ